MKTFKIRCSQIAKIMTEPKTKAAKEAGELSETAKEYCELWIKEQIYNRKKEVITPQTVKGVVVEYDSIEYLNGIQMTEYKKNETQYENDYITGTPDIITPETVIDIKNSWDVFTFPFFDDEPDKGYFWQLQGYMILTGKKRAELVYLLSDAPYFIIESEARKYAWSQNVSYNDNAFELFAEFSERFKYRDVAPQLKVKSYEIDFVPELEEQIYQRVEQCRRYINTLITKHKLENLL